jgi:hypothetical protein
VDAGLAVGVRDRGGEIEATRGRKVGCHELPKRVGRVGGRNVDGSRRGTHGAPPWARG